MYFLSRLAPIIAALFLLAAAPAPDFTVTKPWFRLITPQVPAGGYISLRNGSGKSETLTGVSSPSCGILVLHRTEGDRMMAVPSITLPPGGSLTLAPGGYHLMCMKPTVAVGETMQVTLTFQDGATATFAFPVIGAKDQPPQ